MTNNNCLTVAILGNPNTGKSTLFNALAGMNARVGNYPGVTVEKKVGRVKWHGRAIDLVDLPGTYSLSPRTLDEMVSVDVLIGRQPDVGALDAVVCIVDASNLERNLYLLSQILDLGLPTVLVLNMWDAAESRGITIDIETLKERMGLLVVKTMAHRRQGLDDVRDAILEAVQADVRTTVKLFPPEFYAECDQLANQLQQSNITDTPNYLLERMLLDVGGHVERHFVGHGATGLPDFLVAARDRLREAGCRVPVVEAKLRYAWARGLLDGVVTIPKERPVTSSDRIDGFLTHRFAGLAVFCVLMFVIFQAVYTWAGPLMDTCEAGQDWAASLVRSAMPPGALRSLLTHGVIAGVGGVLVFLPQIMILFFFISILEDCGYMARAAFLMDKLMTKIGLSGRSFVPLMSSFACAVPGIMAARVIESRRDRMVTILIAPLMSCSARLPVYLLLIGAFVPATAYLNGWLALQGLVLFAMTALGAVVAIPVAWLLKGTFFKGESTPFVMELPSYKIPSPRVVLHRVYDRGKAFVVRAGTLIFATTIIVWAAGYFPGDHAQLDVMQGRIEANDGGGAELPDAEREQLASDLNAESRRLIESSFLGRLGHAIEPVVKPLGWDWQIGVAALASFPAREVVISTMGTIYSLGGDVDEESSGLRSALMASKWPDGRKVFNVPVALSIMVFFALCAQCASTLMVIQRETNSWLWPVVSFVYMTVLAYVGAFAVYQIGMMVG